MKILVFNCGSSTLKFQLIEIDGTGERKLARGLVDRIGANGSYRFENLAEGTLERPAQVANHEAAVRLVMSWLEANPALRHPDAAGHRVVHGGERFIQAVLIDEAVIDALDALCELAPLHNPGAVSGIRAARKILGAALPMVAAFDTSFHHKIPERAAIYAIPHALSDKYRIRRFGFHGLAHQYNIFRYAALTGRAVDQCSAVTLHLGNGCSAAAIRAGWSIDTSMGFTPLEGLVMGTRSGDVDPALVSYLARKENLTAGEVESQLNERSGLLGLSGMSNDMRELSTAYDSDPRARLALDVFCYRARKYVGAYLAALDGQAQAVIFSGGIGENSPLVRRLILRAMEWCGIILDNEANEQVRGHDGKISAADSPRDVYVIHTDEESMIARGTAKILGS